MRRIGVFLVGMACNALALAACGLVALGFVFGLNVAAGRPLSMDTLYAMLPSWGLGMVGALALMAVLDNARREWTEAEHTIIKFELGRMTPEEQGKLRAEIAGKLMQDLRGLAENLEKKLPEPEEKPVEKTEQ